ncbi:hypothetical protein D3C75_1107550 [compost metagenome]
MNLRIGAEIFSDSSRAMVSDSSMQTAITTYITRWNEASSPFSSLTGEKERMVQPTAFRLR